MTKETAGFDDADVALMETLDELEGAPRYAAWIVEMIRPHLHGRILEVGAGRGAYSATLATFGALTAVEPSATGHAHCEARLAAVPDARALHGDLLTGVAEGPFDAIVLLNVLEHIEDDRGALAAMRDALDPGGRVILWVPAFPLLMGDFDRAVGHFRRYRIRPMRRLVRESGLRVVESKYHNVPGWFAWLLVVRLLKRRPTARRQAAIFDRLAVPVVRFVERYVRMPFGQSILMVAEKPS